MLWWHLLQMIASFELSSDDGTCRVWDARYSHFSPRIYIPKPSDAVAGRSNDPSPSTGQQAHQILCCAYNANGTVFATGSSDTYARVWNAVKCNPEDSEQPNHEMDVLSGHENDVNYVQFSGCAVASRSSSTDTSKEDNFPKFKNSWFTHDNIVTCSRDGSAIIWIPRSRRSHGKVGRWTRAYHLKVPPPPMPPQPPRGGPRQRFLPTPRGVNMIVWSLDNRFVLATIMDCRICVWNAVDGSLVHSLTGHTESTYVLDVHPFNPRIAMSAGYDGKTIVWDIWEGTPIRIYETGRFKLVDGKFSPDGTSIVLSDEVGQIYVLASGQGESQKDAKYDQFFLGDYRPLIQDTHGNVLDQETQLAPHRRNIQDLLCDSSMLPYPEPYQNMYQQRRLGALGIEWRPPSVKLAVGPQDYQLLPFVDLDRWIEPLPEFVDAMDWEQENEVQSDDNDSEYNATEEDSSEGEQECLSGSSGDPECSAEDSEADHSNTEGLRRSKRRKHKADVEFTTSSGRRVKRRNLDEHDGTLSKSTRTKKSRNGRVASRRRKSSTSKSSRPQRLAARNALNLFSRINGASTDGEEDEDGSESDSSESESMQPDSNNQSDESDMSTQKVQRKHPREKEVSLHERETAANPSELPEPHGKAGNRRRLVLKFAVRDSKKHAPESPTSECQEQGDESPSETADLNRACSSSQEQNMVEAVLSASCTNSKIRWGEVKARTSKRLRVGEAPATDTWASINVNLVDGHNATEDNINGHRKSEDEHGNSPPPESHTHGDELDRKDQRNEQQFRARTSSGLDNVKDEELAPEYAHLSLLTEECSQNGNRPKRGASPIICNGNESETKWHVDKGYTDHTGTHECRGYGEPIGRTGVVTDNKKKSVVCCENGTDHSQEVEESTLPIARKLRIRPKGIMKGSQSPSFKIGCDPEEDEGTSGPSTDHEDWNNESDKSESQVDKSVAQVSKRLPSCSNNKMYDTVYKRSKSGRARTYLEGDVCGMEASTSNGNNHNADLRTNFLEIMTNGVRKTRSMGTKSTVCEKNPAIGNVRLREGYGSAETSKRAEKFTLNGHEQLMCEEWKSSSRVTVGLRSARNRRENYHDTELSPLDRRRTHHSLRKPSWLMLTEHEESYRYIPQLGDEVAYIRQGHQEYIEWRHSHEIGPWRSTKGDLRVVEFCKVEGLDYSTLPGSGESCCKLTLEFIDPSSNIFGKTFKLTLPELIDFSDFLVERTRYDAAIKRNWTHRDKCQVWWRNANEEGGSWWDGRILAVKPKSPEFLDSPWERCVIQYRSDSSEHHRHSPWELHDPDSRWEHPHIDENSRQKLLSLFNKIEQNRNQAYYGIQKLKHAGHKSDFLNRFPVPLSLEVIKRRLENNYYRSLESFKHDVMVMLSNVQSYFGKNAELGIKIRRLSDWVTRTLSSL
ncbi:uncharacterized protein LOC131225699 isoform X2 [Magnolia sinica]|uniref:uncharacterized protein LOC131225699 isoform X2 n=1 Tax=Magnolia sinica TaxID=86752 RepID=UPI0026586876|nr:uncharacterized protein LOC131225699 isoform X2 [Magnolia sinica]